MDKIGILDPEGINNNPLTNKSYSETYRKEAESWSKYPTYEKRNEIIKDLLSKDIDVLLVMSGTGSGKTVLTPKFALHASEYGKKGKIGITFPKRIIARSSAEYAAKTLDVNLGEEVGYLYKNAPKNSYSDKTKMLYMTDGSLSSIINKDPLLSEYSFIIIDEAHERKTQIDLLLLLIKKIIPQRKKNPLKLVIMSATIDTTLFMNYFSTDKIKIKKFEISGVSNYPIDIIYPPNISIDYISSGIKIIKDILKKPKIDGDILFFITSGSEAKKVCQLLKEDKIENICIEVYSDMPEDKKTQLTTSSSLPKLYICTNVAESSITLQGISYVIDSGLELFSNYDPEKMANTLTKKMITKAQATQRAGRAGRTKKGTCYRLYSESQYNKMDQFPFPDIQRSDLTSDFIKLLNFVGGEWKELIKLLNELIEPPNNKIIDSIHLTFVTLKVIKDDKITKLGINLNEFTNIPIGVAVSLLLSYDYGCSYEFSVLVSLAELFKYDIYGIFYSQEEREENRNFLNKYGNKKSDHLTFLDIYKHIESLTDKEVFCKKNGLRKILLEKKIKDDSLKLFYKVKNLQHEKNNKEKDSNIENNILKCLAIGMQMNIIKKVNGKYKNIYPPIKSYPKLSKKTIVKDLTVGVYNELTIMNNVPEVQCITSIPISFFKDIKNDEF